MRKVGIKQLRNLRTEDFEQQPFLRCSDGQPIAVIIPTGDLSEQEIATPKVTVEKLPQGLPKVKIPRLE